MLLALSAPARADVRYVVKRTSIQPSDQVNPYAPRRVDRTNYEVYAEPGKRRVDETLLLTSSPFHLSRIVLADKKQVIRLSPELHLYAYDKIQPSDLSNLQGAPLPTMGPGKSGTHSVTWHIQSVGHETVQGQTATHYRLEQAIHDSGCLGERNLNVTTDVWCIELPTLGEAAPPLPPTWTQTDKQGRSFTFENVGDLGLLQTISQAAILRQQTQEGKDEVAMQELVSFSTAPIDYAVFLAPAGYREVSVGDFEAAVEQWLLKDAVPTNP